ncbi:MAG: hypothetical protein K2N95_12065 [Lachnospiraceae bacterium]|nr:hypothetical protein [Lachnospiraceae bacterium]
MIDQIKRHRKLLYIITAIVIIAGGGIIVRLTIAGTCKLQQDVFFTEYNLNVDTTIFKYDPAENEVSEIGIVKGKFYKCVLNSDKTSITGMLYDCDEKTTELVRYDLKTGTVESQGLAQIVKEAAGTDAWKKILVYRGI